VMVDLTSPASFLASNAFFLRGQLAHRKEIECMLPTAQDHSGLLFEQLGKR